MTVDAWQLGAVFVLLDARRGCPRAVTRRQNSHLVSRPFAPSFPIRPWSTHQGPQDLFSQIKNLAQCPIAPIPTRPTIAPYYPVFLTQHGQKDRYVLYSTLPPSPPNFFPVSISQWRTGNLNLCPSSPSIPPPYPPGTVAHFDAQFDRRATT